MAKEAARVARCLYCEETKGLGDFNREHVVPQSFGRVVNNFVLRELVCRDCNTAMGRELDEHLARNTLEGLDRFEQRVLPAKDGRRVGSEIRVQQRGGPADGAELCFQVVNEGRDLKVAPLQQLGFATKAGERCEWFRLDALPTLDEIKSKGWVYVQSGGLAADEVETLLIQIGMRDIEVVSEHDPSKDGDGMVDTHYSGIIDDRTWRGIAKIAFNYLAFTNPAIASMDQLRPVRRYIRYGERPTYVVVSIAPKHFLGGMPDDARLSVHLVTARWDGAAHRLVAQISLFTQVPYEIVLSTEEFLVPPLCVDSGHLFDPHNQQVMELTRDPRRGMPLPMITRAEFDAAQAREADGRGRKAS